MTDSRDITRRTIAALRDGADAAPLRAECLRHADGMAEALLLSDDAAERRLGRLCFSFPRWRFLTQGAAGGSLVEHFGMTRLARPTDLRDASLPDPARDEFGVGFIKRQGDFYIEYRRAYLLCADFTAGAAVLIRNSSYFFGRDRLPQAVYARFGGVEEAALLALAPQDIAAWQPWQSLGPEQKALVDELTKRLVRFDAALHAWLLDQGLPDTQAFLRAKLAAGRGMPYLGQVTEDMPPWFPAEALALSEEAIAALATAKPQGFTLLSGPSGDLPAV